MIDVSAQPLFQPPYQQIANDRIINRDPVISSTGLAVWMSWNTNDVTTAETFITVYYNGERTDLTAELGSTMFGAVKPQVHSNHLIFVANYNTFDRNAVTWRLREVPWRDEGGLRELDARFIATEDDDGTPVLTPFIDDREIERTEDERPPEDPENLEARRVPSGKNEIWKWTVGDIDVQRITQDNRNDFNPSIWGDIITWQKARGFPFGWEIMALIGDKRIQLTTNFYYDMGPKVHGRQIVWYGWDGYDYEIFLFDADREETIQITDNRFDDIAPVIWNGVIAWEGYASVEADIYMYKDGQVTRISDNVEDDINPRIWDRFITWQGYDGDDYEIFLYDHVAGGPARKITTTNYDDINPIVYDDLLVWMGFVDNFDAEIFYVDLSRPPPYDIVRLTENDEDDLDPQTAGRRIIWRTEREGRNMIMLAEPTR
ncbi:MAG TPA: hypothetical protein PKE55_01245 [Kiritimatiellia bacterium]|nr:hypothetical protein [Kiritimatiellia bacterium]